MKLKGTNLVIATLWGLFGVLVLAVILFVLAVSWGIIGYMPDIKQLQNPIDKYASQVISEDGVVLGSYARAGGNRLFVDYSELSPDLVNALIATEDKRFKEHSGIDMRGVFRVIWKTLILGDENSGGGSTITQQLAKQLYSPRANNIVERAFQKPIEWVIAVQLERFYTKEEIITLYLNQFDFLYQAVGIERAAQTYFGKKPADLSLEEAATLVGMAKNPSYFNPVRFNERTQGRRNVVLSLMREAGYISASEAEEAQAKPLTLHFSRENHNSGIAPYFRAYLQQIMMAKEPKESDYPYDWQKEDYKRAVAEWENNPLYGWCNKNKKPNGDNYDLYADGLKIYTGINSRMQAHAEEAMLEHLGADLQPVFSREKAGRSYAPFSRDVTESEREEIIRNSLRNTDRYRALKKEGASEREIETVMNTPVEMSILAYSKSHKGHTELADTVLSPRDSVLYYKSLLRSGFMCMDVHTGAVRAYVGGIDFSTMKYDMVTQGRRQVGSTMKPYLYSMAMNEGFTPCDQMLHVPQHIRTEAGTIWSPKNAGHGSGGMVSIKWGLQNSSNWVTAWLMGQMSPYAFVELLRSFGITGHMDPVPSISLGTHDISVAEMASGFTTFAAAGIRVEPLYVTRIEDEYGNVVAEFTAKHTEVLPARAAYRTLYMLQSVINEGTGSRVRFRYGLTSDMGGKTGTTQNHSDGWFMGFTPNLSAGCWVGGEDRSIHFDGIGMGQGASMALPIVALFYKKVFDDAELRKRADVLGINPDEKFVYPPEYQDPCARDDNGIKAPVSTAPVKQEIDDLFQ